MQVISYNSRNLTTQEQKLSTYDRELCAITFALSRYQFIVIGSKFPITTFTDHNPILFLFTREGNLTPKQYKAQMLSTKFSNLQIIHTAGTILLLLICSVETFQLLLTKHANFNIKPFLHTSIFLNSKMIIF